MFRDSGGFSARVAMVLGSPPAIRYVDPAGVRHRLWRVTDAESIAALCESVGTATAYIAEGHHRYATALRYRDETGPDGAWTLGYFTPMDQPGLLVLPYHRILSEGPPPEEAGRRLGTHFKLSEAPGVCAAAGQAGLSPARYAFALAWPGGTALVAESGSDAESLTAATAENHSLHNNQTIT